MIGALSEAKKDAGIHYMLMIAGKAKWRSKSLFRMVIAATIVMVMPSADSLWIDEGWTAHFAMVSGVGDFWRGLAADRGAECQKPVGMFVAWTCGKVFGWSEYGMRLPNVAWTWLGLTAIWLIGRRTGNVFLPWLYVANGFVWMYTNEARPYAAMTACGAWLLYGLLNFVWTEGKGRSWPWCLVAAGGLLCSLHMLGIVELVAVVAVGATVGARHGWRIPFASWRIVGLCIPLLVVLGAYYLWTIVKGAGGARLWTPGIANAGFSVYELLGFAGIGPPRSDLREWLADGSFLSRVEPAMVIGPAVLLGFYVLLFGRGIVSWSRMRIEARVAACVFALSMSLLGVAAMGANWPFWGRHLSAAFPFVCTACALMIPDGAWGRSIGVGLVAILAAGSINLRFNPSYRRDNYREAARLTMKEVSDGRMVWWGADQWTGEYYGVRFIEDAFGAGVRPVRGSGPSETARQPGMVVLARPSQFDPDGCLREWMGNRGFRQTEVLQGFCIWRRVPEDRVRR